MLLARLSWPANEPLPPYCGVRRVMSVMRPEIVGSVARSSRITAVAAPVRPELNTGSLCPTTVMVSATLAILREKSRSWVTPRLTDMLFFASDVKPGSDAVTVYGPPTRMPGITKRPSACGTASWVLPEAWCTATTVAPGITAPCASFTTPLIAPVVTPCALARPAGHSRTQQARSINDLNKVVRLMCSPWRARGTDAIYSGEWIGFERGILLRGGNGRETKKDRQGGPDGLLIQPIVGG